MSEQHEEKTFAQPESLSGDEVVERYLKLWISPRNKINRLNKNVDYMRKRLLRKRSLLYDRVEMVDLG